jgi:8-oxo-dGTP pyrophosphatase MutT (NUDIX family)
MRLMSVGYMFDVQRKHVVLIKKKHGPAHLIGYWNGIGGKQDPGETPLQTQIREFREETGKLTTESDWQYIVTFRNADAEVSVFRSVHEYIHDVETMTDEEVCIFRLDALPPLAGQATWCIPMCLDDHMPIGKWELDNSITVNAARR